SSHATWPSPVSWATKSGISRSSRTSGTTWRSCASSSAIPGRHGCATTSLPRPWTACVSTCTARSEALPRGAFRRSTCTSLPVADHWPLVAGLALGLVPRLVFDASGERRKSVAVLTWIAAAAVLILRVCRTAPNDDEVFYLAQSWAARIGDTAGDLPMRHLVFRPFLLPPWAPSAAIVAGRIVMALFTAASALVALRLVRCAGALPVDAPLPGALALVWLANAAEGTVRRPEQFANAGVLLGIALLAAPPARWRAGTTTGAAFLLLTLAASLSHRRLALVPVAIGV